MILHSILTCPLYTANWMASDPELKVQLPELIDLLLAEWMRGGAHGSYSWFVPFIHRLDSRLIVCIRYIRSFRH